LIDAILSWSNALLFFTVVLAFFVKAITGFGQTLVMGSVFSFVLPNTVITPVDFLLSMPANAFIAWRERRSVTLKTALPFALFSVIGLLPGVYLLRMGSDRLLKAILGLVVVAMAIQVAAGKSGAPVKKRHPAVTVLVGLISGALIGAFGVGALTAVYFKNTTRDKHQFRANTTLVLFLENICRLVIYLTTGILNIQVLTLALALSPAMAIGLLCGTKLDKYIDERKMKMLVVALLIISGSTLFVRSVFFHGGAL